MNKVNNFENQTMELWGQTPNFVGAGFSRSRAAIAAGPTPQRRRIEPNYRSAATG